MLGYGYIQVFCTKLLAGEVLEAIARNIHSMVELLEAVSLNVVNYVGASSLEQKPFRSSCSKNCLLCMCWIFFKLNIKLCWNF